MLQPTSFATTENFFNITRNFSFIGIMALGMTAVIATGRHRSLGRLDHGADGGRERAHARGRLSGLGGGRLSVSPRAASPGSSTALIIAYAGISPFVTTLGMLAIARSAAVVLSGNRMLYNFGPGGPGFKALGSGALNIGSDFAAELSAAVPHRADRACSPSSTR